MSETPNLPLEPHSPALRAGTEVRMSADVRSNISHALSGVIQNHVKSTAKKFLSQTDEEDGKEDSIQIDDTTQLIMSYARGWIIHFSIKKDGNDIGVFMLKRDAKNRMDIYHRFVREDGRRQSYGSLLLHAIEVFAQEIANRQNSATLFADIGQENVIEWFQRRGFQLKNPHELADIKAKIASGEYIVGDQGFIYKRDTPLYEQRLGVTADTYAVTTVLEKHFVKKEAA